jgi:hypothetical protein
VPGSQPVSSPTKVLLLAAALGFALGVFVTYDVMMIVRLYR